MHARVLDQAFSAAGAGLVLVAVVFGMQLAVRRESPAVGDGMARRLLGDTGHYWGRGLGLLAVLALLGLAIGFAVVVNVGIRFGDIAGEEAPLRRVIEAEGSGDERTTGFARPGGDAALLVFDIEGRDPDTPLEFRFAPKLVLVGEGVEPRSFCPLAFVLSDPDSGFRRRRVLGIHEGKPIRFALDLPAREIDRLEIRVENLGRAWLVKFDRRDAVILGEHRSLAAGILRGGLILGLLAAVYGFIALFLRAFVGAGGAFLLSLALALTAGSFDLFEDGVLSGANPVLRDLVMAALRVLLPDFDRHDVAAMLVRGVSPEWNRAGDLALRLAIEATLLGYLVRRRGGR